MSKKKDGKKSAETPSEKLGAKDYDRELEKLHVELVKLQEWVVAKGLKVLIVFEGRDGAGKGGTIKALTERVSDPDGGVLHQGDHPRGGEPCHETRTDSGCRHGLGHDRDAGIAAYAVRTLPGRGVQGEIGGEHVCLGSTRLMAEMSLSTDAKLAATLSKAHGSGESSPNMWSVSHQHFRKPVGL